ncbi:MAG TPA: 50S ribosomal protein L4 [Gemmatimonadaceae bacterium]
MAETTFNAPAFTARGTERDSVELPGETFDGTINMPVMHQAVKAYLANRRQGNAATKTRGFVVGGNQKPWRQKGTGRARQGSRRAPNFVGGGTVFGPTPRSYAEYVPRQVRALARKSALNARARENAITVIDNFAYDAPKTKQLIGLLDSLDLTGRKVLILTDGAKPNVHLSCRNIPWAYVLPYSDVSTYHVLWSDNVLIEASALGIELEPVAERERAPKPARAARTAAAAEAGTEAKQPKAKRGAKAKTTAKKAAKSPAKRGAAAARGGKSAKASGAAKKKASPKGKPKGKGK